MIFAKSVTYPIKYGTMEHSITLDFKFGREGYVLVHPTTISRNIKNPGANKMLQILHTSAKHLSFGPEMDIRQFSKKNVKVRKDLRILEKHLKSKWKKKFKEEPIPF